MPGETNKSFMKRILFFISFFLFSIHNYGQIESIIYDGILGMNYIIRDDTVIVSKVTEGGPAEKHNLWRGARIIEIDSKPVSGIKIERWQLEEYIRDTYGTSAEVSVKTRDKPEQYSIKRVPTSTYWGECFYEYLADSSDQLTIHDILSDSINALFSSPTDKKILTRIVPEGSELWNLGIRPGDKILSLYEELDHNWGSLEGFIGYSDDTVFSIQRDSLILQIEHDMDRSLFNDIISQYGIDMMHNCFWLRLVLNNRISKDGSYLLVFPLGDSVSCYELKENDKIVTKNTGRFLKPRDKDFILKDLNAIKVELSKDHRQTFYIRLVRKSDESYSRPLEILFSSYDDVTRIDRKERFLLGSLWGMMLIFAFYYLILFFFIRERSYLYYFFFIVSLAMVLLDFSGYMYEIFREGPIFGAKTTIFLVSFSLSFFQLFGISYLNLRKSLRVWYKIISIFLIVYWILMLLHFAFNYVILRNSQYLIENSIILEILDYVLIISFMVFLSIQIIPTILRVRKGFKPGWYFLSANIVYIVLIIFYTRVDVLQYYMSSVTNFSSDLYVVLSEASLHFGTIIQILLFAFGLGAKMRASEKEKELAQEKMVFQLRENEKLKEKVNRELETKVRERTKEINGQKEEIEAQRDEIESQRDEIEAQRDEVESQRDQLKDQRDLLVTQKREIIDSITYARKIQSALMPPEQYFHEILNDVFILFKPRDIVSGDFYWIKQVNKYVVLAAADCTGHGVPGAFMSMLGMSYLNEIVQRREITQANQVLNELRKQIRNSLRQHGQLEESKDGIDMALCVIDEKDRVLQYSGANNPLYLIRYKNGTPELTEFKADRMPLGYYQGKFKPFTNKNIQLEFGDVFYLFSDGYVDQKGGAEGKKFLSKNFKKLLLEIHEEPMQDQKQILEKTITDWMGDNSQIDDILVIGVRV